MVEAVDVGIFHESEADRRSLWQQHGRRSDIGLVWELGQADQ